MFKADICIQGDGVVGKTLALLLSRLNLRVVLVHKPRALKEHDIRAYSLNWQSKAILESVEAWPKEDACTAVKRIKVHSDGGGFIDFDWPAKYNCKKDRTDKNSSSEVTNNEAPAHPQHAMSWIVQVPALEDLLTSQLQKSGVQSQLFARQDTADDPCKSMSPLPQSDFGAPITVLCEGAHNLSNHIQRTRTRRYPYEQHALATQVQSTQPHNGIAHQWFNTQGGLEIIALLPLGGPGGDSYSLIWSTSPERVTQLKRLSALDFMNALALGTHGAFEKLHLSAHILSWPLAFSNAVHWCGAIDQQRSWVLCGDSAHTVHPLSGMGLNLGLWDVKNLADILLSRQRSAAWRPLHDLRILRAYERQRKLAILPYTQMTDKLQRLFASNYPVARLLRNEGFNVFNTFGPLKAWTIEKATHAS